MELQPVETTLYSLSDTPPCARAAERRDGERLMTLYRVGSLWFDERRELCLIKNISAGGMMVRAYCVIPQGTRLSIELKCGQPIWGLVSWAGDVHVGISFEGPIDVTDLLASSLEGPRPRMPRIEVGSIVTVRDGASTYRMRARDISQGGLKVQSETRLTHGSDVVVKLAGLAPLPGIICWVDGGQMGITFNRMLALPTLVEWLRNERAVIRAAS